MAFRSRKLAKALALAVPCSSFVCLSQVYCAIHRWQVDGLDGLYNDETKDLYIDGGGKIDKNSFKNTTSFPVKDVKRIFIGTGLIVCDNAFADFDSLKSVIISYPRPGLHLSLRKKGCSQILSHLIESYLSERKIGDSAFSFHENLTNVTILGSVTEIGNCAFYGCGSLKEVQLPESLLKIGENTFYNCENLKSIIIPNRVTEIMDSAFYGCESLEEVQLPESLLKIGIHAFQFCKNLKSIIIPNSVTEIRDSAFYSCGSLKEVQLSESLLKIGKSTFQHCTALKKIIIPNSVTEIGDCAFYGCTSLENIQLPESLLKIGKSTFDHCKNLKSIIIPNSVTEIGDYAFYCCKSLVEARVSKTAKIGENAFPTTTKIIRC